MKLARKHIAYSGLIGFVIAGSLTALPAQAQLGDITKAASKAVAKITTTLTSSTTPADKVDAAPVAASDKSARVMVLDKQTNRRQNLVMIAGQAQNLGTVQVKLTKCLADYGAVLGQDVAWLDVTENGDGSGRTAPWFSGWMFNTYPEVSTMDHPRYDVQLLGCGTKARQVIKATGSAPVLDSSPVVDTETPNDAADPYYVPGVEKNAPAVPVAPAETPAVSEPAAVVQPVVDTEAPAVEVKPAQPQAEEPAPNDLHKMMDSGTY